MQAFLKKHSPGAAGNVVKVDWSISGREVSLNFTVTKRTSKAFLSDSVFTEDWAKNWGLWNKDVVEAFIQLRSHKDDLKAPYLEVQVSPLNQPFALVIFEPRKTFQAPKVLNFEHSVVIDGKTWSTSMKFTLPEELKGDLVYGGFFSCLESDPREYYALEPNPENNPDFHRPELFLELA